jgi:hypothetical protein
VSSSYHALHENLGEEARVPLPDKPESSVGYGYLLELERDEGPSYTWRPEGAERRYTVSELLDGVRGDEARLVPAPKAPPGEAGPETKKKAAGKDHDGPSFERKLAAGVGVAFVVLVFAVALLVPEPTPFQEFVFRVGLMLAAAFLGALAPGVLDIKFKGPFVRAGGAAAFAALIYLVNPPALFHAPPKPPGPTLPPSALAEPSASG